LRKLLNEMTRRAALALSSSGFVSPACSTSKSVTLLPKTNGGHGANCVTKRIRPFVPEDVPQVAQLHQRVFAENAFSVSELQAYFQTLFFKNPWYDESLPSLVYSENEGMILGFYGVLPRRMRMKGRLIRVAVSSQFMVDPSVRNRLAAVELQSAFFGGSQDLSFTDGANDASRKIWEGLGGLTAFPYSVHWTRLLRPARYFLDRWKTRGLSAPARSCIRPLSALADFCAARTRKSPFHQAEQPPEEDFSCETLLEHLPRFAAAKSLTPDYDEQSLRWLLEQAYEKKSHGKLRKALVRNGGGQIVGWYMYYLNPNGISQVLQLVATKKSIRQVLDQLFFHAWRSGSFAVSGRMDPEFLTDFSEERCLFSFSGPRMLVHSRHADLREAIQRGDAFLTRLEGEWWMRLQGG
jgi:Acetyltransferase (GNAT) domain